MPVGCQWGKRSVSGMGAARGGGAPGRGWGVRAALFHPVPSSGDPIIPPPRQVPPWDVHRLPRARGKTFLVTGGNAGIGYFVAEQLAGTGAAVVLGSRDRAKA